LFLKATINKVPCSLLVDTGATLTILSSKHFENLLKEKHVRLVPVTQKMTVTDGTSLQVHNKYTFHFALGNHDFSFEAVVADISTDSVPGLDFLKRNKCLVDISSKLYVGAPI
jgi:hypothetical protein